VPPSSRDSKQAVCSSQEYAGVYQGQSGASPDHSRLDEECYIVKSVARLMLALLRLSISYSILIGVA